MDTIQFKTIGFSVCESHFKNEAAMTTWVLTKVSQTSKSWIFYASVSEIEDFWKNTIEEAKQFVKESIGEPYEPKSWETLSHLVLDDIPN